MNKDFALAEKIAEKYDKLDTAFVKEFSEKYRLDAVGLYPRLLRAVGNQTTEGRATVSRYALFMDDIVRYIDKANELIESDNKEDAVRLLERSRNALAAFSKIQMEVFDTIFKDK